MLVDFYIPRLSHDMKIAVQKSHLSRQILYRSPNRGKKTRGKITLVMVSIGDDRRYFLFLLLRLLMLFDRVYK